MNKLKKTNQTKLKNALKTVFKLIILFVFIYAWISYASCFQKSDNAYIEGRLIQVMPRVSGTIIHLYADNDQEVKKGDLLMEIDPRPYEAGLRQIESEIKSVRNKLNSCEKSLKPRSMFENTISAGQEYLFNMSNYQYPAKIDATDMQVKQEANDDDKINPASAGTNQKISGIEIVNDNKKAALSEEQEKINPSELELRLKQLEAQAMETKLELSCTKIYAPQDGIISSKTVDEGDYVEAAQSVLSVVPKYVQIIANFKEFQTDYIASGQPVKIKIRAYPWKTFKGVVDTIQYPPGYISAGNRESKSNSNREIPVKILFTEDYSEYNIVPGTNVTLTVKVK